MVDQIIDPQLLDSQKVVVFFGFVLLYYYYSLLISSLQTGSHYSASILLEMSHSDLSGMALLSALVALASWFA